jgi:hypothetical protein
MVICSPTKEFCRNAGNDSKRRNIVNDNGTRADNCAFANSHARENGGIGAYVCPCADADRLDFQVGADDRHVDRHCGMA